MYALPRTRRSLGSWIRKKPQPGGPPPSVSDSVPPDFTSSGIGRVNGNIFCLPQLNIFVNVSHRSKIAS
jgi:hypothetical protein